MHRVNPLGATRKWNKQLDPPFIYIFLKKKGPSSLLYRSWNCTGRRPISNRAPLPYSSTRALHCLWRERRMACVRASGAVKSCRSARIRACDSHTPYVTYQRQPFEGASSINRKKKNKKNVRRIAHGSRRDHVKRFVHDEPTPKS